MRLEEGDADSDHDLCVRVMPCLLRRAIWLDASDLRKYLEFENRDEIFFCSPGDILLAAMCKSLNSRSTVNYYDLSYNKEEGKKFKETYAILEAEGLDVTEEERQIIDGTHELYKEEN